MAARRVVGKCGVCGGPVSLADVWMSVNRQPAVCEKCGAIADETAGLPTIPMLPKPPKVNI